MRRIQRLSVFAALLQLCAALVLCRTHHFCQPTSRNGEVVNEEIAAVWLGYDDGAENVFARMQIADLADRVFITNLKIGAYIVFVLKLIPKLSVPAELQTFQQGVLTPREQFGVHAPHSALPCLFGSSVHPFQILYGKPFFAVSQVIVYGLQVLGPML